jgi:hypothetical protein
MLKVQFNINSVSRETLKNKIDIKNVSRETQSLFKILFKKVFLCKGVGPSVCKACT